MNRSFTRLAIIITLFFLVSLACNVPILNQIQSNFAPADDTGSTSPSDGTTADIVDSGSTAPSNTDGAELTFIPGATFQMGSATSDLLADEDELPQHQVTLDEFYIYTHEVTNQMYADCVEAGSCMNLQSLEAGPTSHFEDPEHQDYPVVGVDWVMARDYCAWAGSRLPTEAEWELTSRGPDSLLYPWGEEEPTCDHVNMGGCAVPSDTQPVGHFLMGNSPDGAWDLSGNVWEWVHDWYADDYYGQSPSDNPIGPLEPQDPEKPLRVIRGGGLYSEPVRMRSAARIGINPYRVFDDVGFRCVTGEGLSLPAAYDHGEDRHERVPPGRADGGDSADDFDDGDDGDSFWADDIHGPCPDEAGNISLTVHAGATVPLLNVFAFYEGIVWDAHCDYDPATEIATCEGPAPAGYLDIPPPSFPIDVCFAHDEGTDCIFDLIVWKPTDCGRDLRSLSVEVHPGCIDTDTPAIIIRIIPPDTPFGSASTDAILLTCDPLPEDGFYLCHGLPGSPGDVLDIHVSIMGGPTTTYTVEIPDCSVPFRIEPHCLEVDGVITPSLILQFPGVEAVFVGATANGTALVCEVIGAGIYSCHGLPGVPGDALSVIATFDTGATLTNSAIFPPCPGTADFIPPWELVGAGCLYHDDLPPEYYAVIDTSLDVEWTSWSLEGVSAPLRCDPDEPPIGRWYCVFAIRDWYEELTFCAEWVDGTGEYCETFPDIEDWLPDSCPVPDDEGDWACTDFTGQTECEGHVECEWGNNMCYDSP